MVAKGENFWLVFECICRWMRGRRGGFVKEIAFALGLNKESSHQPTKSIDRKVGESRPALGSSKQSG